MNAKTFFQYALALALGLVIANLFNTVASAKIVDFLRSTGFIGSGQEAEKNNDR